MVAIIVVALLLILALAVTAALLYANRVIADPAYYEGRMAAAAQAAAAGRADDARRRYARLLARLKKVPTPGPELSAIQGRALLALGDMEQASGRLPEALTSYREAIRLITVPPATVRLVAADYAAQHSLAPEALDAYLLHLANIRGESPADEPVLAFLQAWSELQPGADRARLEGLAAVTGRIVATDPDREWAHFARGLALARLGDTEQAIAALLAAERLAPQRAATPFHLGMLYVTRGEQDAAYAAFRRTLTLAPDQPEALYQVARILVERARGDPPNARDALAEAQQELIAACRLAPERAELWRLRGEVELQRGDSDAARQALAEAARLAPANLEYQMALAGVLLQLGDAPAAIVALRRALEAEPQHTPALVQLGQLLLAADEAAEAEGHFRRAVALAPGRDDAREGLGRSLYAQGRWDEAVESLRMVGRPTREGLYALGRSYGRGGDVARAAATYDRWLAEHGTHPDVLFYLGCAQAKLGDWRAAVDTLREAETLAQEPRGEIPLYHGTVLMQLGRHTEAREALERAAVLAPTDPRVAYARGMLAVRGDDWEQARAAFAAACDHDASFASAHVGRAVVAEHAGELAEAGAALRRALDLSPGYVPALIRFGVLHAKSGDWPAALAWLQAAADGGADTDELLLYLGAARAHAGDYSAALAAWECLYQRRPEDEEVGVDLAVALHHLGQAALEVGDPVAAHHWERSTRLCPDVPAFRDCLVEALVRLGALGLAAGGDGAETQGPREALERAAALDPDDLRPPYYLGLAALVGGDPDRAAALLEPLTREDPDDPRYRYHLALAQLASGDAAGAWPVLEDLAPYAAQITPGLALAGGNAALALGRHAAAADAYRAAVPLPAPA